MKLTKRMQNALIQGIILNSILFVVFTGVFFGKIYPGIQTYEGKKKELQDISSTLQAVQNTGVTFDQFKDALAQLGLMQDSYIFAVLQDIDAGFFQKHFSHTEAGDYDTFLKNKQAELVSLKSAPEYIEKNTIIHSILPFYSGNKNTQNAATNDVAFINYVESILYNFNLEATGDIGVGQLEKVESLKPQNEMRQESEVVQKSPLQEDIYKIPLSFEITGRKSDILDFIHFFENVGTIEQNGDTISVYSDTVLSQVLTDKIGDGKYNIYKNQIATIYEIQLAQYPDSSNFANQGAYKNLVDTIRSQQSRDAYSVQVVLHFYISGLPVYKIEESIKMIQDQAVSMIQEAEAMKVKVSQSSEQNLSQVSQNLSFLQSFVSTLHILQEEVTVLQSNLLSGDMPADIYEQVSQYQKQLLNIKNLYESKFINISVK